MLRRLAPLALLPLLLVTACGNDDDNPTVQQTKTEAPLANLLPQAIRDKGTLVVGSDVAYAPVESFDTDNKTVIGMDPDLAKALGEKLGVTFTFQNATFKGLITSLNSKRFDILMSAMSDTAERRRDVDFVDYFTAGTSIIVKKGNPQGITKPEDFCGKTIALQEGTTQDLLVATPLKKTCGSKGLNILRFDTDPKALLQVKQGRAVADMNDFPVAAYNVAQSSDFEVVGEQIQAGPYGIAVRKADTQLRDALQKAMQAIIDDGTYAKILQKWHVEAGAIKTVTINGGT